MYKINIEIKADGEDETLFTETCNSFEQAQEVLGRAERYIGRLEERANLSSNDTEF